MYLQRFTPFFSLGEQTKLYHGTNNTPSIIVTNDEDDEGMEVAQDRCFNNDFHESNPSVRMSALPSTVVQTPRPPLHS